MLYSRPYQKKFKLLLYLAISIWSMNIHAQTTQNSISQKRTSFLIPSDTLSKKRFWSVTAAGAVGYTGALIGMNELWYKQFPRSGFHLFNDWKEWNQMDKAGHLYTGYFESVWFYKGAKWTGLKEEKAILVGAGIGLLLQSSVELLDGFSTNWGFSLPDMASNVVGVGAFYVQQKYWGEQRISFKVSAAKRNYSSVAIDKINSPNGQTFAGRAEDLYGATFAETFLKDYNAQTIWASINIHSFLQEGSSFPKWLNIAFGYGAENLYGGFGNNWKEDEVAYSLPPDDFPRYRQFYLSTDIDFTKIPTKKAALKTLFTFLNIFKVPAPALEINTNGGVKFIGLHY